MSMMFSKYIHHVFLIISNIIINNDGGTITYNHAFLKINDNENYNEYI